MRRIRRYADRVNLFTARALRAWRFYRRLNYSWRLSWIKAGYQ